MIASRRMADCGAKRSDSARPLRSGLFFLALLDLAPDAIQPENPQGRSCDGAAYFALTTCTGGRLCVPAANLAFNSAAVERKLSRPLGMPRYALPVFFAKPAITKFWSFS